MTGLFDSIFSFINNSLGDAGVFIICFCMILACFISVIIPAVKGDYPLKKRVWFVIALLGVCALEKAISQLCYFEKDFSTLNLAIGALFCIPVFYAKKRKEKTQKARDFIKFIDSQVGKESIEEELDFINDGLKKPIRMENFAQNIQQESDCNIENSYKKQPVNNHLDFTHVKNVIARLEYLSLGNSDRRQIRELESVVAQAEAGDYTLTTKEKINDGLGALLKIMSKYGV